MTDIVERLRGLRFVHVPAASGLMEEAAAEIERLREAIRRLAEQDATLSVQGGNVTVTMDATLTDEERAAILASQGFWALEDSPHAATLRKLLERLNHDAVPAAKAGSDEARTDKAATSHRRDGTGDTQEPVAWAVALPGNYHVCTSDKANAGLYVRDFGGTVVPLFRSPTLTDAEREAVEFAVEHLQNSGWGIATLRNLLERLNT